MVTSSLVAEKKIAILERAIKSNPRNEVLLIRYLTQCRAKWEPVRLSAILIASSQSLNPT
jgi:hypothetical protein